jgi:hypothetical protein
LSPGARASSSVHTFAREENGRAVEAHEAIAAHQARLGTERAGQHLQHFESPITLRVHDASAGIVRAVVVPVDRNASLQFEHDVHQTTFPAEAVRFGEDVGVFALAKAEARDGEATAGGGGFEYNGDLRALRQLTAFRRPAQQFHRLELDDLRLNGGVRVGSCAGRRGIDTRESFPNALDGNADFERSLPFSAHDLVSPTLGCTASTTR